MKHPLIAVWILIAMAGCAKVEESGGRVPAQSPENPSDPVSRYLAYQHTIDISTEEERISAIFDAAQTLCREAASDLCTVLESRIRTGWAASASLKFRAKRNGIRKIIEALGKQVEITDQSTIAQDLTSPIEDSAKKLAMLTDYRSKLEALRGRADSDIDALIKVNRELSQVQSELEATAANNAHLVQRVETEILIVSIGSAQNRSFWRPIASAWSDFGGNLSQGVSIAITGIAYLIPWVVLLSLAAWIGRRLWRRRK